MFFNSFSNKSGKISKLLSMFHSLQLPRCTCCALAIRCASLPLCPCLCIYHFLVFNFQLPPVNSIQIRSAILFVKSFPWWVRWFSSLGFQSTLYMILLYPLKCIMTGCLLFWFPSLWHQHLKECFSHKRDEWKEKSRQKQGSLSVVK